MTVDGIAWTCALLLASWVRFDFVLTGMPLRATATAIALAIAVQSVIGYPLYLYRGRYGFGTFDEARAVGATAATTTGLLFCGDLLLQPRPLPASTPLTGGAVALLVMLAVRYVLRLHRDQTMRPATTAAPVLIFGAGIAGTELVRTMLRDPRGKYLPAGFLDDDPGKRHLRVGPVHVLGGREHLAAALTSTGAGTLVFAVPSAPPQLIGEIRELATTAGAEFKVLPSLHQLIDHRVSVSDIRDLDVSDLLGRGQIHTDVEAIAGYLTGRRVLVTGAGGSIGSELCRQIHRFQPAALVMLDRDESALHAVQLSITGRALLDDPNVLLADLRDEARVAEVFRTVRPQVVFHAAALKHQPLLEQYPAEAVKTNVWGTSTVLDAATATGVEVFVNISTDKAADPCSVLGYSKRVTERLTAHQAAVATGRYLSVRFGNVLGSRGSVLTTFADQIARGGPVTVTDPEVTRYFMTVQEAVQLVIQAGAVGEPGEALVLDMGQPVRIADVARQMASLAGRPVDIIFTGLRQGEKLAESLFGTTEHGVRRTHPLISHVTVPPVDPAAALAIDPAAAPAAVTEQLAALCRSVASDPTGARLAPVDLEADLAAFSVEQLAGSAQAT